MEIISMVNMSKGSLLKPGTGRDSDGISRPVPATKTRDETDARNKTEAVRLLYATANP